VTHFLSGTLHVIRPDRLAMNGEGDIDAYYFSGQSDGRFAVVSCGDEGLAVMFVDRDLDVDPVVQDLDVFDEAVAQDVSDWVMGGLDAKGAG